MEFTPVDAVLFDMDGVITDTAEAHAAAWKRLFDDYLQDRAERTGEPFVPFDIASDYRTYVDGKPRYDGVRSFLKARGIELASGQPDDAPRQETVCGLGNRKNDYFQDWLETHKVQTFPDALAFIGQLTRAGKTIAVFSSSRNAQAVLENAGAIQLFNAKVDGTDLAALNLPGKPDPAMLFEAARRLDADPARTAVVEDAVSGVQAGAAGRFRPVIGVARDTSDARQAAALRDAGADLVVGALSELRCAPEGLSLKTLDTVPTAWQQQDELRARLTAKRPALFLDYDGTLTPIVEDYTKAILSDDMRDTLTCLAERYPVTVVSGRDLKDVRNLVRIDSLYYSGSHGFELSGPGGWHERLGEGERFLDDLDAAERDLRTKLAGVEGHAVERKTFAIAVHYRRVPDGQVPRVEEAVDEVTATHGRLRKGYGKKVFQIKPRINWDKGHAVNWLLEHLDLGGADALPLYIGDDITDEDVFRALAGRGLGIVLRDGTRTTSADYALTDPQDVQRFLEFMIALERSDA